MSNKSMFIGLVAGIGIATAGGVAAYQFLGKRADGDRSLVIGSPQGNWGRAPRRARPFFSGWIDPSDPLGAGAPQLPNGVAVVVEHRARDGLRHLDRQVLLVDHELLLAPVRGM